MGEENGATTSEPLYQIGIDCGSKTVKVCISDSNSKIVHSIYRRHRSNIKTTLSEIIHELNWRYGNIHGTIAVTGSAGISVAEALGLPFVQEVIATTKIVKKEYPQADCVIELGGEDAKVIYLTGGLEQRMNATCAGGTGGFIDNIAYLLGVRTSEMDKLSMGASLTYPIASRCAVFAQSDIRPLMNAGARTSDLAGSTLDAVVRQTLGGLACGRPITGTVVFLGGPFEFLSDLSVRFRKALGLNNETGIRPADAQFFTARGAGLHGAALSGTQEEHVTCLQELEQQLKTAEFRDAGLARLEPLFRNAEELKVFKERHAKQVIPRENIFFQKGPVYVGIDAGSTAVKIAVVNEQGHLVWSANQENHGDVLETTAELLSDMYAEFPREYRGSDNIYVAHAVATGYGEDMLKACLGVDSGVVETTAHVQGALSFVPDASFVLDIGGQDMKAIWVQDGLVQNAILNEACSSGCGSFLSGIAWSLRLPKDSFAEAALSAQSPVDLGTKCTVFMNSRLKHAQKVGASTNDLAAGCAYSVVKNALFRIIGLDNLDSLGDHIVVQGGTFMNDAVLRAFELLAGKEVVRPDRSYLMGALGAALVARKRAHAQEEDLREGAAPDEALRESAAPDEALRESAAPKQARSTLISREELRTFAPKRTTRTCEGCANQCTLSVVTVEGDQPRNYIGGNRCGKALDLYANTQKTHATHAPNAIAVQRSLLERIPNAEGTGERAHIRVGIMNTLLTYRFVPFWHAFFQALGFSVVLPREEALRHFRVDNAGAETIPSESVCYPAKLSHRRLKQLVGAGATHVFMPCYMHGSNCSVSSEYVKALQDGAMLSFEITKHMISPVLSSANPLKIADSDSAYHEVFKAVSALSKEAGCSLSAQEFEEALNQGANAQTAHEDIVRAANEKALAWVASNKHHHGILLTGRPYHTDAATGHRIDEVLSNLGFAVLSPNVVSYDEAPRPIDEALKTGWKKALHLMRLANYAFAHERIDVVALYAFGCLYDGISVISAGDYIQKQGHLFTALKVDEMVDTAHLRIRLRTLAENIEQIDFAPKMPALSAQTVPGNLKNQGEEEGVAHIASLNETAPLGENVLTYAKEGSILAFSNLCAADVEAARLYTRDLCYSTAVIIGRSLRILQACPQLSKLVLPNVCQECVLMSVPFFLRRATGRNIEVSWEDSWPTEACTAAEPAGVEVQGSACSSACITESATPERIAPESAALENTERKPLVGVLGTAPLVFDSYLNDNLAALIKKNGCTPVFPELNALFTSDVHYYDQLQNFYDKGVRYVIYLQSFGCLKGHVQARGSLHSLTQRFPGMTIVVLDYDPEASALNRENRILLTLEAARNS